MEEGLHPEAHEQYAGTQNQIPRQLPKQGQQNIHRQMSKTRNDFSNGSEGMGFGAQRIGAGTLGIRGGKESLISSG